MPNVDLIKPKKLSTFRKIAMGTWKTAKDPSVYGELLVDMTEVNKHIDEYQKKHDRKITPAHLVGRAVCYCISRRPEINAILRYNRIYYRKNVGLFYQVNIPGEKGKSVKKANLAGAVIHNAEFLNTAQISESLSEKAGKIKKGKDKEIKKNMNLFNYIPWSLTGLYLNFVSWLLYTLNLDLSFAGVPKDPFGSVMVTSVGGLGIDLAWAPIVPYSKVPMLLAVGSITDRAWVVDSKVEVRPILPIGVTFDHRLIDGIHAAQMAKDFKYCFENPNEVLFNDDLEIRLDFDS